MQIPLNPLLEFDGYQNGAALVATVDGYRAA